MLKKKERTNSDNKLNANSISKIIDAGQSLVIRDMGRIYDDIMRMEGKSKVECYLKFSKFFFIELPTAIPKETESERIRRETMEITDKFSEDKIEDAEEV